MWFAKGFKTKNEAKIYQKTHGGEILWEQRSPKTRNLTEKGKDFLLVAGTVGIDTSEFPYLVNRRIKENETWEF